MKYPLEKIDANAIDPKQLAKYIDHTILKPDATADDVKKLCSEARAYGFASVCINPAFVALAAAELAGSPVKTCTVIGFPLGASTPETKAFEAADAVKNGAAELDMVIAIGALKAGDDALVERDIRGVVQAANGNLVKVIIETCLLTEEEKARACAIAKKAGADIVKTSTGFSTGGATAEDVALMKKTVGEDLGVKASGGVRDFQTAVAMINAGAMRIGTSSGAKIVEGK